MKSLKQKLSSRKLWAAVVGVVTGLAMVFGLDEGTISNVAGAVVSVASVVAYIVTEGRIDAAAVKTAVEDVQAAVSTVSMDENTSTTNAYNARFDSYE
jgi:phage shock protein PspC (stress-responsive transcriptional regulator)